MLEPGAVLGGKYKIERIIGQGGMGIVALAHHEELDHHVAIKVLLDALAVNAEIVARFTREARAAAKLQSEHVARVSDVGRWEGVGPYMVMEYLQGNDLAHLVVERGSLPIPEAVDYVLEALDALAEAHSSGIVHRDLKPSNLFLADRNDGSQTIKVLDFGISKTDVMNEPASSQQKLTSTRSVMGSPGYMSPEQLKSARDVDARADIWSVGVVLFELLTGSQPFDGETVGQLFANVLSEPPKALRRLRGDVPEVLEGIVMRCLQKDVRARYANVGELAQALAPFGSGRATKEVQRAVSVLRKRPPPVSEPSLPQIAEAPPPAAAKTQNAWNTPQAPAPGRHAIVAVAAFGGVLVVGLALGAALLLKNRGDAPPATQVMTDTPVTASATAPAVTATDTATVSAPSATVSASVTVAASTTTAAPTHTTRTGTATTKASTSKPTSTSFLDKQR